MVVVGDIDVYVKYIMLVISEVNEVIEMVVVNVE